jgi:hypothetical protein
MTLEIMLLVLESALLVVTIVLLFLSLREGRSRDALIAEVGRAMKILSRHEYFITVTDAMMDARVEVLACITGRMPTTDDDRHRTRDVAAKVERLAARGVRVSYILPRLQDRLHVGWLYSKAGADVRYSGCPLLDDFRYTVVDDGRVIVGVAEGEGEKQATKEGYLIPSTGLARILKEHFTGCEHGAITFDEYLHETMKATGASAETLARELRIDPSALK